MEHTEQLLELYHKLWIFFGTAAVVSAAAVLVMFVHFRIPKILRKRRWILVLTCVLLCQIGTGNGLSVRAEEEIVKKEEEGSGSEGAEEPEEPEGSEEPGKPEGSEEPEEPEGSEEPEKPEEPEEPEEPEDTTAPMVEILWKNEQGQELEEDAYYQNKEELTMELLLLEEHLDTENVKLYLEAFDVSGKPLDIPEVSQIHEKTWTQLEKQAEMAALEGVKLCYILWEEDSGIYRLQLHLNTEANYHIFAYIRDQAGNTPKDSEKGYLKLGSFCLDRSAPVILEKDGITWEAEHEIFVKKLLHQMTFGYFGQPDLRVKIQAFDVISGIEGITYICEGMGGEEVLKPLKLTGTAKKGSGLVYEEGGTAYVVISLPVSFQGTIRAQAWDRAGELMETWTQTTGILLESKSLHKKSSRVNVWIEGESQGKGDFYRGDVHLKFVMEDSFSGIRALFLAAGNQERRFSYLEEGEEVRKKIEQVLTIPASENNQNHIPVFANLIDFAGHTTQLQAIPTIHIDTEPPKVQVEWLNQDVRNERYYRADQIARITVRERNFVPDQVHLSLTGKKAGTLLWVHHAGKGCGGSGSPGDLNHRDDCTWTTEIVFDQDGTYTLDVSCQDAAGNQGSSEETKTFVIDKTPPVLKVHWDGSEAVNTLYYAKKRSAVLEIKERNLRLEDVKISVDASHQGKPIAGPGIGQLRQWEEDSFRGGVAFEKDGRYQLEVSCVDLAGNEAVLYQSEEFVIDQTPPELFFEGVEDGSANQGAVAPELHVTDANFDSRQIGVSLTGSNKTGTIPAYTRGDEEEGVTLLWGDFERIPENDDLYCLKAKAGDLAGNITEKEITFSVNRFGSVYKLEEATAKLAGPGGLRYTASEPELVITEYNPDFLDYYQITSSREGEITELLKGRDYQVEEHGRADTWKTYRYRIGKENFQKEGIYLVTLYSEDRARNASSNRIKEKSLEFIVDKTGPSIVVTGAKDRQRIQGRELQMGVDVRDAFALARAELYLNGQLKAAYDREELQKLGGMVTFRIPGAKAWQTFAVKAWDEAGNVTETSPIRFLVTEQVRFRFLGDDDPKQVWVVYSLGLLLLAGAGLIAAGRIRRRLAKEKET